MHRFAESYLWPYKETIMKRLPLLSLLLLLVIPLTGFGQSSKGTLTGRVTDTAGAVLQGATIQIIQNSATYVSDKQGEFVVPNIAPGSYEVKITFVGFAPFDKTVTVIVGQPAHLDAVLQVASASQNIVVTATSVHGDAEAINRINSSENILNVLTNDQIMSLPNADVADALGNLCTSPQAASLLIKL
jgi:protocatechuate 3,4-dioxygenase beta subunit